MKRSTGTVLDILSRAFVLILDLTHQCSYRQLGHDLKEGMLWYHLDALRQASRNQAIPTGFKKRLDSSLEDCQEALKQAIEQLDKVQTNSYTGKIQYSWFGFGPSKLKSKFSILQTKLTALEQMCSQLHRLQTGPVSSFLRPEYFKLIHERTDNQPGSYLPMSDIWIAEGNYNTHDGRVSGAFILEKKFRENDVRFLCNKLMEELSTDVILQCLGYRQPPYNELEPPFRPFFQIVMALPDKPRCSLAYRIHQRSKPALKYRLRIARRLAKVISRIHDTGLVHKSIRPRAILLVGEGENDSTEQVHVQDWTYVRSTTGATSQLGGDDAWQRAIYQHPDRQCLPGSYPEVAYETKHDIYSLGVTLLEILLWIPFVEVINPTDANSPLKICGIFEKRALEMGEDNGGLPEHYLGDTKKLTGRPEVTKNVWMSVAATEPAGMESKLSKLVLDCIEGKVESVQEVIQIIDEIKA